MGAFLKPKKGTETGSNFDPEMGPRIEAVPHVSRGRGPVSGIVLGPNFGPKTCGILHLNLRANLALFWLGGSTSEGFPGKVGARLRPRMPL